MDEQLTPLKPEEEKLHTDILFANCIEEAAELEETVEKSAFDFSRKNFWKFEFLKTSNGFCRKKFWISNILKNFDSGKNNFNGEKNIFNEEKKFYKD